MDEKLRILKMVEEGKMTADQAAELLEALKENTADTAVWNNASAGAEIRTSGPDYPYESRMLRVVVDSPQGDKVNVQLPVKIIRQVLKVTGKLPIQTESLQSVDVEALTTAILECIDNESMGNIVDVSAADGTTVKVYIG